MAEQDQSEHNFNLMENQEFQDSRVTPDAGAYNASLQDAFLPRGFTSEGYSNRHPEGFKLPPPISYQDEDEELLFGPTSRPQDSMAWAGRSAVPRRPRNLERYLPKLTEAARQPDAPKELLDFMRVLAYHIGSGE